MKLPSAREHTCSVFVLTINLLQWTKKMAYRLPVFNVRVNVWHDGHFVTDPPDLSPIGNFNLSKRVAHFLEGELIPGPGPFGYIWLLTPIGTAIVGDRLDTVVGDCVEVPQGAGIYYHVAFSERSALGFANEHVASLLYQIPPLLPPPPDNLLLEDGTDLLLEDGTLLLIE